MINLRQVVINSQIRESYKPISYFDPIKPENKLYSLSVSLSTPKAEKDPSIIKMISMIKKDTSPAEFKDAWKNNPNYKLEMRGPLGPALGGTGLHKAISAGNLKMVKFFIKELNRESIDSPDESGYTPFMYAISNRIFIDYPETKTINFKIIHELLKAGADVNLAGYRNSPRIDGFNTSALSLALERGDIDLIRLLMQYGAKKLYAFTPDRKSLVKQWFSDKENELYKQVKKELKISETKKNKQLFLLGAKDPNSLTSLLPKEIFGLILTKDQIVSPYHRRIKEAKKMIAGL